MAVTHKIFIQVNIRVLNFTLVSVFVTGSITKWPVMEDFQNVTCQFSTEVRDSCTQEFMPFGFSGVLVGTATYFRDFVVFD